jgi:serine/threonine-protein kinase SRPK3
MADIFITTSKENIVSNLENNTSDSNEDSDSENLSVTSTSISDDDVIDHKDNLNLEGKILNKFNILHELGKGTYSIVWLGYSIENKKFYAIKVQHPDEYKDGKNENNFMKKLPDNYNFNNLVDSFTYIENNKNFLCSVYNLHSCNIDCLIRKGKYQYGIPYNESIQLIKELIQSLYYLHQKLKVFHGDLKTDNILVKGVSKINKYCIELYNQENFMDNYSKQKIEYCNLNNSKVENLSSKNKLKIRNKVHSNIYINIKNKINNIEIDKYDIEKENNTLSISLADFGSFVEEGEYYEEPFGTRYYRSPENILVGKSSYPNDIWALGCTIYEILTGKILFDPAKDKDYDRDFYHLKLINELSGDFPKDFLKNTKRYKIFFDKNYKIKFNKNLNFKNKIDELNDYQIPTNIIDLIKGMLVIDPTKRSTIKDCLSKINSLS